MSSVMNPARPAYPRRAIGMLQGYENGRLDDRVLMASTARGLRLNPVSARKFNALQSTAVLAGIALSSTGDYRTRVGQETLLTDRYDRGFFPNRGDYNTYQGQVWSLKLGQAMAATPGLSPHGWGRARDFALMSAGTTIPRSLDMTSLRFLAINAPRFGIFFDTTSEDWHGEDYAGDAFEVCPGLIEYEGIPPETQVPTFAPEQGHFSLYPFNRNKDTLRLIEPNLHSDLVAYLQGVFKVKMGYGIMVDGWFGRTTSDHVKWFQGSQNLQVDGVCGPRTWEVVDRYA